MFASATYGTIGIYFFCKLQSNDSNLMIIITGKYGNLRFKLKVPNKLALGDKVIALQHTQAKTFREISLVVKESIVLQVLT